MRHERSPSACLEVCHGFHLNPFDSLVRPLMRDAGCFSAISTDVIKKDGRAGPLETSLLRRWLQVALLLVCVYRCVSH